MALCNKEISLKENLEEYIAYYLDRIEGPEAENAFHSLIEAPKETVPLLVKAFNNETRSSKREVILEIICQFRDPITVPILIDAMRDDSEIIWKRALDGIVTLGGEIALEILHNEKTRFPVTRMKTEWIDEAIEQIREESA